MQLLSLLILPHYQRTPLHIAARENYERTVECLVDKGAGINIKDKAGVSHTTDINTISTYWLLHVYDYHIGLCKTLSVRKSMSTECTSSPSVLLISYTDTCSQISIPWDWLKHLTCIWINIVVETASCFHMKLILQKVSTLHLLFRNSFLSISANTPAHCGWKRLYRHNREPCC